MNQTHNHLLVLEQIGRCHFRQKTADSHIIYKEKQRLIRTVEVILILNHNAYKIYDMTPIDQTSISLPYGF